MLDAKLRLYVQFDNQLFAEDRHSGFATLLVLIGILMLAVFLGTLISSLLTMLIYGYKESELNDLAMGIGQLSTQKGAIIFMQVMNSLFLFFIAPIVFLYFYKKKSWRDLNGQGQPDAKYYIGLVGLTMLVSYFFLPINSLVIEWNENISFPESMKAFEESARTMEDRATHITKAITQFDGLGELFIGIVVIGLLPAIGEELLFRGVVQNALHKATKNPHLAIIITGIVFSAFHFQLFGFVPRTLLGILFGYLYFWSKNIWIPIWAHFVNNGGTVIMMYLFQQGHVNYDIENEGGFSALNMMVHTALFAGFLYLFWRQARQREQFESHGSPMAKNI